jgi:hypothetical protein
MEAIRSSETSGTTQRITRRHIPEEDTLQNHRCENLKSYKKITVLQVAKFLVLSSPFGQYAVILRALNMASYFQRAYITSV